jgi:hypothetical protein
MEIEFAFRKESSGLFGSIGRPVARLIVIHRRRRVPQLFYVDSGADITLIPKSVGDLLGLTLASPQEIREIKGIGERGVPILIRRLRLQVQGISRQGWLVPPRRGSPTLGSTRLLSSLRNFISS